MSTMIARHEVASDPGDDPPLCVGLIALREPGSQSADADHRPDGDLTIEMLVTATTRRPAVRTGTDSGSSASISWPIQVQPTAVAASRTGAGTASRARAQRAPAAP